MHGSEAIQLEHISSLVFHEDSFVFEEKPYSFDEVVHVKFTASKTQHSINFIPTGTSFETDLRVLLSDGKSLRIKADRGFLQREARFEAILRAAEIIAEVTFTQRMENYESELADRGFITWDGRQFASNGDLFQAHEFRFNLKDKAVEARLGVFHLQCHHQKPGLAATLKSVFIGDDQLIDISTDRDCFLYFMKNFVGLSWPNEQIRSKRRKSQHVYYDAILKLGAKL